MKYRRKIGAILISVVLICVGCQVKKDENEVKKPERQELVLWSYYETDQQKTALDELMAGFNESQEEYEIKWEYNGPVTEFNKKLAIGITQKQLPDLVIIDNPDMRRYVEQGVFEDITKEIEGIEDLDQYYPNVLSSVIYDGKYYGMPFCCNNAGLIYNRDLLKEKGVEVPATWAELVDAAKKLTDGDQKGFALSAIDGEQSAFQILPFILSAGDGVESLGGEGTRKAFMLMQELIASGAMSKECINWSQNDLAQKFIAGDIAMMQNGPWVLPALDNAEMNYEVTRLPIDQKSVGVAGGENMGVLKGKNVKGAVAFLKYYNQNNIMLDVALRANSMPPKAELARMMLTVKPEYRVFIEVMPECISRSSYKVWPQVTELLSEAQFQVITGSASPDQACEILRNKITGTKN